MQLFKQAGGILINNNNREEYQKFHKNQEKVTT